MLNSIQRDAKNEAAAYFRSITGLAAARSFELSRSNIIGWGIGTGGTGRAIRSGENCVRVYVREFPAPIIPKQFGGLPTEVVEVGEITIHQISDSRAPVSCGVSVGHPNITAGTLGCLVEKEGNHYILSNNHVLANSNEATPGDPIIQPGRVDGGTSPDNDIATLEPYQEIDFSGAPNAIDAAIALVGDCNQTLVTPDILDIGYPDPDPISASLEQTVQKHGRTTGRTIGVVEDISADILINFGRSEPVLFEDQILVKSNSAFAQPGDSGSLIVDEETLKPVALLFACNPSGTTTIANPIDLVLNYYNVTVVGEQGANV